MYNYSEIDLFNSEKIFKDDGGRSTGYFCLKRPVKINRKLIEQLKKISDEQKPKNLRLCLHSGPESDFHDMIIFERKGKYYPPHKHLTKGESFHIIEGNIAIFSFEENGVILDATILSKNENIVYKIETNMYHAVFPISDLVIYHEAKTGPFLGDKDSILPSWAPKNDIEIADFQNNLLNIIEDIRNV